MNFKGIKKSLIQNAYLGIAPLIIGAILLCVYMMLDVYPFGTRSISYYDMSQSFVPLYYHTWDVLHGVKNIYFDWNVGMGCSVTDVAGAFLFFPSNLFFLFIKRENVLMAMSVFLMLKMMFSAFSMSFYVSKQCSSKALCVYAGIAYGCCGYILQYYTNIFFLDVVMIFPLFIWALDRLIFERKKIEYIILVFLCFFSNQQIAFTVVIYIILKGWMNVCRLEKEHRGKAVFNLVFCSLTGFLIAAFSFIPSFYQMTQSARFSNATSGGLMDILMSFECEFVQHKHFMLYGAEIGLGCFIFALFNKGTMKKHFDKMIMIMLLLAPIVFENINLLWHGGAYQHFPMRFGYMLSFEMIGFICALFEEKFGQMKETVEISSTDVSSDEMNQIDAYQVQEQDETKDIATKKTDWKRYVSLFCIALIPVIAIMLYVVDSQFRLQGIRVLSAYKGYGLIVLLLTVYAVLLCLINSKKVVSGLLITLAIVQAALGSYGLISPYGAFSIECGDVFPRLAQEVHSNMEMLDATNRIKDRNLELNSNYGFILDQSSLGCWMNGVNANIQGVMAQMGYTFNYTRVLDGCGTALTDAVLGIRRLYSVDEVNSELYSNGNEVGTGKIYDCNYVLPFGLVWDGAPQGSGFEYQNSLFKSVTGSDKDLFREINANSIAQKSVYSDAAYIYEFDINAGANDVLYLYGDRYSKDIYNKYAFVVNDEQVTLDAEGTEGNMMYAMFFLNGYLELGTYHDETVSLKVLTEYEDIADIHVGFLDLDTMEEGFSQVQDRIRSEASVQNGKMTISIDDTVGGELFIPIGYYDYYKIRTDGQVQDYYPVLNDAFVGMNIEKGSHIIEISYSPKGLGIGCAMTVFGILLLVVMLMIGNKDFGEKGNALWTMLYKIVFGVMVVSFYFIPVFATFFVYIYRLLVLAK